MVDHKLTREENRKLQLTMPDNLWHRTWNKKWKSNDDRLRIAKVQKLIKGNMVVDLGCGDGIMAIEMARKGFNVIGVNRNKKELDLAISHLYKENDEVQHKVNFIFSDIEYLNQPGFTNMADTITICEVLEHVYDPDEILKKIKQIGKKNARLVISVPNKDVKKGNARWSCKVHIREFNKESMTNLLRPYCKNIGFWSIYEGEEDTVPPFLIVSADLK